LPNNPSITYEAKDVFNKTFKFPSKIIKTNTPENIINNLQSDKFLINLLKGLGITNKIIQNNPIILLPEKTINIVVI